MCGIVGYTGKRQAKELLLNCLEKLEYRGYDSAGIAVLDNSNIKYAKTEGRIQKLKKTTKKTNLEGFCGIAHTRWASTGRPTDANAHPHLDNSQSVAVVHNGTLENYGAVQCRPCVIRVFNFHLGTNDAFGYFLAPLQIE